MRLAAPASAAAASPIVCATTAGCAARAASCDRTLSELSAPASPGSHSIWSARRAVTACQKLSATTATPAAHPAAHPPFGPIQELGSSSTTWRTPGNALAAAAFTLLILPPSIGARSIEATSMPGTFTSIPNWALPSTLDGVSSRRIRVPTRRKSFGSLRGGSFGTGSCAPLSAARRAIDLPRRRRRVDQHLARRGARLAQRLPRRADRGAAAGAHGARPARGILGHGREPYARPIGLELLGEDHGETGLRALAHLGLVDGEGDDPVGTDAQPGVGGERRGVDRRDRPRREMERNDESGAGLDELAAGDAALHCAPSAWGTL